MNNCQEFGVDIPIVRSRDRKKRYCTRQCWLKVLHRSGTVPYAKNSRGVTTHGHAMAVTKGRSHEYRTWTSMRGRCKRHPYYVNKGVKVYDEWNKFTAFLDYVLNTIGEHPGDGWSIDRINNERGYEPGNVRWATVLQQRHNQQRWIERHHGSE